MIHVFIRDIRKILDEFIYVADYKELKRLLSPNQLRGKIIIFAPRDKWSELTNICQIVSYNALEKGKWFEVSSLSGE